MSARTFTPDVKHPDGSRTIHMKRACNGCGQNVGDPTDDEMDRAIAGLPLPDVRSECKNCQPLVEAEADGCKTWHLTERTYDRIDNELDRADVFTKQYTANNPDAYGVKVVGMRIGHKPGHVVAFFGDWIIRHPDGGFTIHKAPQAVA
jgi:hypothetical protein